MVQGSRVKVFLDIVTVGGAVLGSTLLAMNTDYSKYGYLLFLASSVATITLLLKSNTSKSILTTNIFFVIINCIGIYRWFS